MLIDFYQYRLWTNCNNGCKFCLHRGSQNYTITQMKASLDGICQLVKDIPQDKVVDVSLIGGEIFDDQLSDASVQRAFYELLEVCASKKQNRSLRRMMICTSLIFDIDKHLMPCIEWCKQKDLLDSLMLCTSYDTAYRFKTVAQEDLWKQNMEVLSKIVKIPVHTEMILTKSLIYAMLHNKLDVEKFQEVHHTTIDFIEPTYVSFYGSKQNTIEAIPEFFPSRKDFMRLVKTKCIEEKVLDLDSLLDIRQRSKFVYFYDLASGIWKKVDDKWETDCRRFDEDGQKVEIYTYADSDKSMTDDVRLIKQLYEK